MNITRTHLAAIALAIFVAATAFTIFSASASPEFAGGDVYVFLNKYSEEAQSSPCGSSLVAGGDYIVCLENRAKPADHSELYFLSMRGCKTLNGNYANQRCESRNFEVSKAQYDQAVSGTYYYTKNNTIEFGSEECVSALGSPSIPACAAQENLRTSCDKARREAQAWGVISSPRLDGIETACQ